MPESEKGIERYSRGIVLALIVVVVLTAPTLFSPWTVESGRLKLLVLHLAVGAMLAVITLCSAYTGRLPLPKHRLYWPVAAWFLVGVVSVASSTYPFSGLNELWRQAMWIGLYVSVVYAVRSLRTIRLVVWMCIIATVLVIGYGIAQRMGYDVVKYSEDPQNRLFSSIGNPNMLAGFLLLMLGMILGLALDVRSWTARIVLAVIVTGILWALLRTYTKGAWLALVATCALGFVWLVIGWRFPYALSRRRRIILLITSIAIAATIFVVARRPILERLTTFKRSADVRIVYWIGAKGIIEEHPFLGGGYGAFQIIYPDKRPANFRAARATYNTLHAHCEPLEILAELGIVGLLVWCWFLFTYYREVLRKRSPEKDYPVRGLQFGMMLGITALLLHNLVDVNLRWYTTPTYFWLFLGLAVVGSTLGEEAEKNERVVLRLPENRTVRWALAVLFLIALGSLVKVRAIDTWRSEICYRNGSELTKRAQWSAALAQTDRSIALNPSNLRAYYQQAYCYYEQKMYGEAIRSYLHLEQLAPNYCQLQYNLAILYSLMGRWAEAAERFFRAEKSGITPEGFSSAGLIATLRASGADQEKYLAVLQKVVELSPDDPLAHNRLGIYWYERGEFSRAGEEFQNAIKIDDSYIPALNNLAGIYYRQKNFPKAIQMCTKILEISPQSNKTRVNLGRAYYLAGQREQAVAEWKKALENDPNESEAATCLEQLGQK